MSKAVINLTDSKADALVTGFNALKRELNSLLASPKAHADVTSVDDASGTAIAISAADGDGTLPTLLLLCADIQAKYLTHLADAVGHKVADTAPALTTATDLATAETILNAIKTDYEAHRASTTYHYAADSTNTISAANATDQASADTLANELKADINAHILLALSTRSLKLVGP